MRAACQRQIDELRKTTFSPLVRKKASAEECDGRQVSSLGRKVNMKANETSQGGNLKSDKGTPTLMYINKSENAGICWLSFDGCIQSKWLLKRWFTTTIAKTIN